jgi:hypothetical protein
VALDAASASEDCAGAAAGGGAGGEGGSGFAAMSGVCVTAFSEGIASGFWLSGVVQAASKKRRTALTRQIFLMMFSGKKVRRSRHRKKEDCAEITFSPPVFSRAFLETKEKAFRGYSQGNRSKN